jgi:hypothetical protein
MRLVRTRSQWVIGFDEWGNIVWGWMGLRERRYNERVLFGLERSFQVYEQFARN